MTTIICQIAKALVGKPSNFKGKWEIAVPREGWETAVHVSIGCTPGVFEINIAAHGHCAGVPGSAYYPALFGKAPAASIAAEWIDTVLPREIETAVMAAQSFREQDLSEEILAEEYKTLEFHRGMRSYFDSTLDHCGK